MPTTSRLFETDPWIGPRLKARKLNKPLLAIKPRRCRVIVKSPKQIEARHGKDTGGITFKGKKGYTVVVCPNIEQEAIAHEFGHAALRHPLVTRKETVGVYIRHELAAWQWAVDTWAKPNKIKAGITKERKLWLFQVMGQTMKELYIPVDDTIAITKEQMKILKMNPMTKTEERWLTPQLKYVRKEVEATLAKIKRGEKDA